MIKPGYFVRRWWYRKVPWVARAGMSSARAALSTNDLPKLGISLAAIAYGVNKKRNQPKLIYSTSIDTDQSFKIKVLRGRRPIAEARVDR
ncbi:MAG: hypothetical protein WCC01_14240 [Acidimicrobiia bacterium]